MLIHFEQKELNGKRMKLAGSREENACSIAKAQASSAAGNKRAEESSKPSESPKQDYIHVRARRGQATDSHSLAERVIPFSLLELSIPFNYVIPENYKLDFRSVTGALDPDMSLVIYFGSLLSRTCVVVKLVNSTYLYLETYYLPT